MNEEKFSGKAEIYDKYRPTYPTALIEDIYSKTHSDDNSRVADIGAGTGAPCGYFFGADAVQYQGTADAELYLV